MNTDAVVRAVVPGRVRRLGIALLAAAVLTGPLAYALWWYLSPGWQPAENAARPPLREPRTSAATQPPEKALAPANPASALAADAGPTREFPMPAIEPAPAATAEIPVERATEPAHTHHEHTGHRGHAEPAESASAPSAEQGTPRTANPADAHGVRPAAARSENPTQPPPARAPRLAPSASFQQVVPAPEALQPPPTPEYPETPKKHVRHFDPDNPYGE